MTRKKVTQASMCFIPLLPSLEIEGWGSPNHSLKVSLTKSKHGWLVLQPPLVSPTGVLQIKKAMLGGEGLRKPGQGTAGIGS